MATDNESAVVRIALVILSLLLPIAATWASVVYVVTALSMGEVQSLLLSGAGGFVALLLWDRTLNALDRVYYSYTGERIL